MIVWQTSGFSAIRIKMLASRIKDSSQPSKAYLDHEFSAFGNLSIDTFSTIAVFDDIEAMREALSSPPIFRAQRQKSRFVFGNQLENYAHAAAIKLGNIIVALEEFLDPQNMVLFFLIVLELLRIDDDILRIIPGDVFDIEVLTLLQVMFAGKTCSRLSAGKYCPNPLAP